MSNPGRAMTDIRVLEELSAKDTFVHRIHPVAHVLVTLGFIVTVASYGKYALSSMLPMVFFPLFVFALGEIPPGTVLRRILPALPLVLGIGIFNPVFDRQTVVLLAGVTVSAGWVSFLSIVLRGCLAAISALLLVCIVGIGGIASSLRTLRVPKILVMQLELTFRYIHVLTEEAGRMSLAYRLRAPGQKGIAYRQWGPFAGQWLLRTLGRAERLHRSMLCRGYHGELPVPKPKSFMWADLGYLVAWSALFALIRLVNIPQALGALILAIGG